MPSFAGQKKEKTLGKKERNAPPKAWL